jgi:5-methylcytosine-specific restriction endonuclease McrA
MSKALVLNASFEALSVVPARRALLLVLSSKAEIVHSADGVFRSERTTFPSPSVVRLLNYVKISYKSETTLNRRAVFIRDGGKCQYCDSPADSIDHVVPRSRGGGHRWDNVVAACSACNSRKRDRYLDETNLILRSKPVAPRRQLLLADGMKSEPDWVQYLDPASASLTA